MLTSVRPRVPPAFHDREPVTAAHATSTGCYDPLYALDIEFDEPLQTSRSLDPRPQPSRFWCAHDDQIPLV